jgi:hypothetical protein
MNTITLDTLRAATAPWATVACSLLLLIAGCGERPAEPTPKAVEAAPAAKAEPPADGCVPVSRSAMPAAVRGADAADGWTAVGPPVDANKPGVPMGRSDNQLVRQYAVPPGATRLKITLAVSSDTEAGAVILDVIWSAAAELARSAPSVAAGPDRTATLREDVAVPAGAQTVVLVARPWRPQDGVLTLGAGELVWCR